MDKEYIHFEKMNLLGDKIFVKPEQQQNQSGFVLMENSKDKPCIGIVIKVGDGKVKNDTFTTTVKIGDRILFQKWNCSDIIINQHKYMCLKFEDVLGVLHD